MLKSFIEHIQKTAQPRIETVDGRTFVVNLDGESREIRPVIDRLIPLELNSLDALVKMVKSEGLKTECPIYITIPNHLIAICFGQNQTNSRNWRQTYYIAKATDVPGWEAKEQMGFEEAQIALRTRFQETPDNAYAIKLLSDISCGAKVVFNDNGIATTVTTQKGIALQENSQVRPIVTLRPYRTFQEVEQPESIFLIRINERAITFIEADGGMWKLAARRTIADFLREKLEEEVESGKVIIAL